MIRRLRYMLLAVLLLLIAFSYHPAIAEMGRAAGMESGTILSKYVRIVFLLLFAVSVTFSFWKDRFMRGFTILLVLIALTAFLIWAIIENHRMVNTLKDMVLCYLAVIIGWKLHPTRLVLEKILLFFSVAIFFCGFMQVLQNVGGFVIRAQYLADFKNSLGGLLAMATVSMAILWRRSDRRRVRHISFLLFLLGFVLILTIRARGALLAALLVILLLFINQFRRKNTILTVALVIIAFLLVIPLLPDSVYQYIHGSLFAGGQGLDISSGRFATYRAALDYLMEDNHLWFGVIDQSFNLGHWIHNFPLLQAFRYGVLFSAPILALYFYLVFFAFRRILRVSDPLRDCGYALVMIMVIISLLEPTFPFSPGTVTLFSFMALGFSLRFRYD